MYRTNNITYWNIETIKDTVEALKNIAHETECVTLIKQINRVIDVFQNNADRIGIVPSMIEYDSEDDWVEMRFFNMENTKDTLGSFFNHIEITIYDNDIVISEQRVYSIAPRTEDDSKLLYNEEDYRKMFNNLEEFLIYLPNHKLND